MSDQNVDPKSLAPRLHSLSPRPPSPVPRSQSPAPLPPSPFRLLIDPPASGAWNMAVDEALLEEAASEGRCTMRFYRWEEPTLSLGYFQEYADRWGHTASCRCPVVRRSSGGGAILHDCELTYSLAIPERHPLAAGRLQTYHAVHETLIDTLASWGIRATVFVESASRAAPDQKPFLCFQRRSPGDVLVGDAKIAGSAQRRCRGAVLQHGSVLLARSIAAPELEGLKELSGNRLLADTLIEAWSARISQALALSWMEARPAEPLLRRADELALRKYASPSWTEHRNRDFLD